MSSPAAMLRKRTQILGPLQKTPYKTEVAKGITGPQATSIRPEEWQ